MDFMIEVIKNIQKYTFRFTYMTLHTFKTYLNKYKMILVGFFATVCLLNYFNKRRKTSKPNIITNGEKLKSILLRNSFALEHSPNVMFPYGILQTIVLALNDMVKNKYPIKKEYVTCENGDKIVLQIVESPCADPNKIIFIIPGLTSTIDTYYIDHYISECLKKNLTVYFFNHRGLGDSQPMANKKSYCAGSSDDVKLVYDHIMKRFSNKEEISVYCTGFSMGGNLLTKFLAEYNNELNIKGAIAICPAIHLLDTKIQISSYFFGVFNWLLSIALKRNFLEKSEHLLWDKEENERNYIVMKVKKSNSINEFDENFTAVHFGFKDADDYYHKVSSIYLLEKIKIPLLFIFCEDDPIIAYKNEYNDYAKGNENIAFMSLKFGGHLAFLSSDTWRIKPNFHNFIFDFYKNL